jgi:hypothetical protein
MTFALKVTFVAKSATLAAFIERVAMKVTFSATPCEVAS